MKAWQKEKHVNKAKWKKVVPHDFDTPPPKGPGRKNETVFPTPALIPIDDDNDESESCSVEETVEESHCPEVEASQYLVRNLH